MTYPLASSSWDEKEIAAIERVMASGMYSMGDEVAAFERDFARFLGTKYCVMVNSGSSANLLMVAALRYRKDGPALGSGAEVIVPAVSWSTTYYPLYQYGLNMRFVDVDPKTLNFDLEALAEAITPKTSAILAVNLLGNPNNFDRMHSIIGSREILLIEDNCESLGATYDGRQCGTFGIMGSFSAFFSHHISTMEGGIVTTDDEELYHILLALRAHGWTRNLPKQNRIADKGDNPFEESFRFVLPGYNLRPLEMSGAIGREQIQKLPEMVQQRRCNARRFKEVMEEFDWLQTQTEVGESSWFGFSMILNDEAPSSRNALASRLATAGIDVRPIVAGNFTKNAVLKLMPHTLSGNLTGADIIDQRGLFVGNHHYPMVDEFNALVNVLRGAQKEGA